jgi:hypothetical protein
LEPRFPWIYISINTIILFTQKGDVKERQVAF